MIKGLEAETAKGISSPWHSMPADLPESLAATPSHPIDPTHSHALASSSADENRVSKLSEAPPGVGDRATLGDGEPPFLPPSPLSAPRSSTIPTSSLVSEPRDSINIIGNRELELRLLDAEEARIRERRARLLSAGEQN